ncbi:MAG: 4Fe-4S cluster-binding domain-containing protein [Verrucomicrobia bacterium]|nr:4Fe-4S cluster-binding domain-containing protein [Verrucomicrobiota bacterium]MCF7708420.1 4Fe-4S cluster-binding domain-containing protein [Verrucomicrobiota bacterium]
MKEDILIISEIFLSVQGEGEFTGWPCVLVRLTGCNLRCSYCDTTYAFSEGSKMTAVEVADKILDLSRPYRQYLSRVTKLPMIEFTGGEPLLQPPLLPLMNRFVDDGFVVMIETNGAEDISEVNNSAHIVMDIKCPSSGEHHRNRWDNIQHLKESDEIKLVIASQEDYAWAKENVISRRLADVCQIVFSHALVEKREPCPVLNPFPNDHTPITRHELAERILHDALPVRFQTQLHKIIWPDTERSV